MNAIIDIGFILCEAGILRKTGSSMKEEASKEEILYAKKIAVLESALKKKTELLINALREKG